MNMDHSNHRGFTLLELIFAVSVGSVVIILAAFLLKTSSDRYGWIGGNIAVEREARSAIYQLTSDLATGQFHPQQEMTLDTASWAKERLGFLTRQPTQAQAEDRCIGDLCAVHYYLKDCRVNGQPVRCLIRGFRASADSFKALYSAEFASLFVDQPADEPIAFGVISFTIRPQVRDKAGVWIGRLVENLNPPESFSIRIVLLRREFWGRLLTASDWDTKNLVLGDPADVLHNPNLKVYEVKIPFGNYAKF